MRESSVKIRRARQSRCGADRGIVWAAWLSHDARAMAGRLKLALREKNGACLVAETKEEGVVGWVHVSVTPLLEVERRAEVNGLVVDEKVRSRGAGWSLLRAAEEWARKKRCKGMSVQVKRATGTRARILLAAWIRALQDAEGVPQKRL